MRKKRSVIGRIWFVAIAVLLFVAGGLSLFVVRQREKLESLKSSIAALKQEHVPMRFKIISRSGGGLKAKLKLYDMDENEIAAVESEMTGESLFLDFVSVSVDEGYLAFPKSIFTEMVPPEKGLSLFPLYDRKGFPEVFATKGMSETLRAELTALFSTLKQGRAVDDAFGNAVHDITEFKAFETGVVYRVVARLKGGIEVIEDVK